MSGDLNQDNWWKGWAIPLVVLEDSALVLRVVGDFPKGGVWDTMEHLMSLHLWKKGTDALFLYFHPGEGKLLGFQFNIMTLPNGVYIDRLYTAFQYDPKHGPDLRGAMLWVLFDLCGIEEPWNPIPPNAISPTTQAEMLIPRATWTVKRSEMATMSTAAAQAPDLPSAIRATDALLQFLTQYGFLGPVEDMDEREEEQEWFTWRLYLGGPKMIDLMVEKYEDEPASWSLMNPDGKTVTDDFDAPLEVFQAFLVWWDRGEADSYIEAVTPKGKWWPGLEPLLEPFFLLNAPLPLVWSHDKLVEWATQVGLL